MQDALPAFPPYTFPASYHTPQLTNCACAVVMEPAFGEYLKDYTDSPAESTVGRDPRKTPFLRRLLHAALRQPQAAQGQLAGALQDSYVLNGLECKLSTASSKVRLLRAAKSLWSAARGPAAATGSTGAACGSPAGQPRAQWPAVQRVPKRACDTQLASAPGVDF